MWVPLLGWEDSLEEEMAITPVFLPGKLHGQRRQVGYSLSDRKESNMTEHTFHATAHFIIWLSQHCH